MFLAQHDFYPGFAYLSGAVVVRREKWENFEYIDIPMRVSRRWSGSRGRLVVGLL